MRENVCERDFIEMKVSNNNKNTVEQLREMKARCKLKFKRDLILS